MYLRPLFLHLHTVKSILSDWMEGLSPYSRVKPLCKDTLCKDTCECDSTKSLKSLALVVCSFNMLEGVYAVHRYSCQTGEVFGVPFDHLVCLIEAEISELNAPVK
jgi:hypothetical protein